MITTSTPRTPHGCGRRSSAVRAAGVSIAALALPALLAACGSDTAADKPAETILAPDTTAAPPSTLPPSTTKATVPPQVTGEAAKACPPVDGSAAQKRKFDAPQPMCIDVAKTYTAKVSTTQGDMVITFDAKKAPLTVNNFVTLARWKYFDGIVCHRVVKDFVVQCGDPTALGTGGPGYAFPDELPNGGEYKVNSVAMANSGPNTNGSQFFLITGAQGAALPPNYSLFGEVTSGADVLQTLNGLAGVGDGPPTKEIKLVSVTITEG